jgi:hypothetical protein
VRRYGSLDAAKIVGITYRQLDYWDRIGGAGPTISGAYGSGSRRRYAAEDLVELGIMAVIYRRSKATNARAVTAVALRAFRAAPETECITINDAGTAIRTFGDVAAAVEAWRASNDPGCLLVDVARIRRLIDVNDLEVTGCSPA